MQHQDHSFQFKKDKTDSMTESVLSINSRFKTLIDHKYNFSSAVSGLNLSVCLSSLIERKGLSYVDVQLSLRVEVN